MSASLCLLFALAQNPFGTAPAVAEPDRLALTPKLDGQIDPEEWDEFASAGGAVTYFQWQPGVLHAAGKLPVGSTMVLTLDLRNDGWLQGNDNLEVRVRWAGDKPECKVRALNATLKNGPAWEEAPMFQESIACAALVTGETWTVEVSLSDPGLRAIPDKPGSQIGVRMDSEAAAATPSEPFTPRIAAPLKLVLERGSNLPGGLRWKPEIVSRAVAPGARFRIRMTFNGANELDLRKIDMYSEGFAKDETATMSLPFPAFDNKGRAFVDYNSSLSAKATDGYRIMRTTVSDGKGQAAVFRTSYAVSPLVVFDIGAPGKLKASDKAQKVRCSVYARSNSMQKIEGVLRVAVPQGWTVESGDDKGFLIYNPYGRIRRVFELMVPPGVKGTFPVRLQADLGGKSFTQTAWITVS